MSEYIVSVNDKKLNLVIQDDSIIYANAREYTYELIHLGREKYLLKLNNKFVEIKSEILQDGRFSVLIQNSIYLTAIRSIQQEKAAELLQQITATVHEFEIKAPMPGMILKINKKINESISQGETILTLEAMNMENDLRAPHSGIIKNIFVKEGYAIEKGTVLFTIE
ncbi:MAG: biotin/lipoyl-containing protein [Ignavibacteriaceae bacterium]|jgi:biotin carboxyl carrier protein